MALDGPVYACGESAQSASMDLLATGGDEDYILSKVIVITCVIKPERRSIMKARTIREYPDLLSVLDVMDILRVGRVTVYHYINDRKLAARKIAGKYRIPKSSVIALVREIEKESCYNDGSEGSDDNFEKEYHQ